MIIQNKRGKLVSKKQSAAGKKNFANIKAWTQAVMAARKALNVTGYVTINGKTPTGKALYAKAKTLYSASAVLLGLQSAMADARTYMCKRFWRGCKQKATNKGAPCKVPRLWAP